MQRKEYTLDEIREALTYISPDMGRNDWVAVAMGLRAEFGDTAFEAFDEYSSGGKSYKASECKSAWKSCRGSGVTIATVIKFAMEGGWQPRSVSDQESARMRAEGEKRRAEVQAKFKREEELEAKMRGLAIKAAQDIWEHHFLDWEGKSNYLTRKQVRAFGVKFVRFGLIYVADSGSETVALLTEKADKDAFWAMKNAGELPDSVSFLSIRSNTVVVPLVDDRGIIQNLQFISEASGKDNDKKKPKLFLKHAPKSGKFHWLNKNDDSDLAIVAEGYSTAASILMAVPDANVMMGVDSGNLLPCAPDARAQVGASGSVLFALDNDQETFEKSKTSGKAYNPGVEAGAKAANVIGGCTALAKLDMPDGPRNVDFNDVHIELGLGAVREQLEDGLQHGLAIQAAKKAGDISPPEYLNEVPADEGQSTPAPPKAEAEPAQAFTIEVLIRRYALVIGTTKVFDLEARNKPMARTAFYALVGAELGKTWFESDKRRIIASDQVDQLLDGKKEDLECFDRFVYLYPSQTVWDKELEEIVRVQDLKVKLADTYSFWESSPKRLEINLKDLVFDPTQTIDETKQINMFNGLSMQPCELVMTRSTGPDWTKCQNIISLVTFLCNKDKAVVDWLTKWLAYPLQHLGSKMGTAVLMHSEIQGSGKSLLFDVVMRGIYGKYGKVLGQHQLESQYTDWRSQTLYGVFEEIFSRNEKFNQAGILKQMITGETQRIEKKFMSGWEEANYMNSAFLSNEILPFPVEASDRRMLVVWPKEKIPEGFLKKVLYEIENGGIEMFYRYLLEYDTSDFGTHTPPLYTDAKAKLIYYGLPTWELFFKEWSQSLLDAPFRPCLASDLYDVYRQWCRAGNEHVLSQTKFSENLSRRVKRKRCNYREGVKERKRAFYLPEQCPTGEIEKDWLSRKAIEFRIDAGLDRIDDGVKAA